MPSRLRRHRLDISATILLALIVFAFFYPLWGQGGWLPFGGGDAVSFLYPMYRFIASSLSSGEIPLWNPHQYAGYPLIADNQSGMFYPINLVLFLLHPNFGYQWMQVLVGLHLWWAGVGTYFCVVIGRDNVVRSVPHLLAGLFAGIAFMFSDLFITHLGNLNLIAVAAWLPWAFLVFRRALTPPDPQLAYFSRYHLLTGLVIGISTLAGHGQMTFYIAFVLGLYALWRTVSDRDWRPIASLVVVGLLGFGLSALTLLPTYEMNELSRRGAFSYAQTVNYSLPWRGLVGILTPDFYGRGAQGFWANWDRVEVGYMGVTALVLAVMGVFKGRQKTEDEAGSARGDFWFYVMLSVLGLLLALGGNTPVHRLVLGWAQLPFQVPARFVLLMNFGLALLAAQGVLVCINRTRQKGTAKPLLIGLVFLIGLTVLLIGLRQQAVGHEAQTLRAVVIFVLAFGATLAVLHPVLPRRLAGVLLIAVLSAELFATSQYVEVDWGNPLSGYQNSDATAYLQANADLNRIDEATGLWQASSAQMTGLYSAGGVFNPLELASHAVLMGSVGYRGSPTYSLMGIKYIVADKSEPPGDTAFLVPVHAADPKVDVYLNTNALPRAQMLYESLAVPSQDAAFEALFSGIDFTRTVIVEDEQRVAGASDAHTIAFREYGLNRAVIDVETAAAGYLLLTDMWYPHWVADVDGVSAEIIRANYGFRAVYLQGGKHTVTMQFQPRSWQIGLAISSISWVGVLGGLAVVTARTRTKLS